MGFSMDRGLGLRGFGIEVANRFSFRSNLIRYGVCACGRRSWADLDLGGFLRLAPGLEGLVVPGTVRYTCALQCESTKWG